MTNFCLCGIFFFNIVLYGFHLTFLACVLALQAWLNMNTSGADLIGI